MGRQIAVALYVLAMVAAIVGLDLMFFRNRFWERLMVNIGIVLVFAAFYLRFLKPSASEVTRTPLPAEAVAPNPVPRTTNA